MSKKMFDQRILQTKKAKATQQVALAFAE